MITFFLAGLVCVPRTDVCAPDGSQLTGTITESGGSVTLTPAGAMTALGAKLAPGAPVQVRVNPWGDSHGARGAIVHVEGELANEQTISGVRVDGKVTLGQMQGRKGRPQLVAGDDLRGGALVLRGGRVAISAGMKLSGAIDLGGGRFDIASPQPFTAYGLDLAAGTLHVEERAEGPMLQATLARPQLVGGVQVEGELAVTLAPSGPIWWRAKLVTAAPLATFGLPDGEAPAGTVIGRTVVETRITAPSPVTVCGAAFAAPKLASGVVLAFDAARDGYTVYGTLATGDIGDGIAMTGHVTLYLPKRGCARRGGEGVLARPAERHGMQFAAKTKLSFGDDRGTPYVIGTLLAPTTIDGFVVTGEIAIHVKPKALHLDRGTLARAALFEAWSLPVGTKLERHETGWAFTVPAGMVAHAIGEIRGERIDGVTEARSDAQSTSLALAGTFSPKGTRLRLSNVAFDHATGCLLGGFGSVQRSGLFTFPADGSVTTCGGAIVDARGDFAVPSLGIGGWFATAAIAGVPGKLPATNAAGSPIRRGTPAGYWIQIDSLCTMPSGIAQPPARETWIWVDAHGVPANARDRSELTARAAKPGTPCPEVPCCPPSLPPRP